MDKWDLRFLDMAELVASWSKDPAHKVGCVLVDQDRRVLSIGYNGPPKGVLDSYETKEEKNARTLHAEHNAVLFARGERPHTAYIHPFFPCSNCCALLIQAGVQRIVATQDSISRKWNPAITQAMCDEAGVILEAVE